MNSELELLAPIQTTKKGINLIHGYSDFVKHLYIDLNLKEHSDGIFMSVTDKSEFKLIRGNRTLMWLIKKGDKLRLILPLKFRSKIATYPNPILYDKYFFEHGIQVALWAEFESGIDLFKDEDLYVNWKNAVKSEIESSGTANSKSTHNSSFYKVVMDKDYRAEIFAKL